MIRTISAALVAATVSMFVAPAMANDNYIAIRGGLSEGSSVGSSDVGFSADLETGWVGAVAVGGRVADLDEDTSVVVELEASVEQSSTRDIGIPPFASITPTITNYTVGPNVLVEHRIGSVRLSAGAGVGLNVRSASASTQGFGALINVQGNDIGGRYKVIAAVDVDLNEDLAVGIRGEYTDTFGHDDIDVSVLNVFPVPGFEQDGGYRVLAGVTRRF